MTPHPTTQSRYLRRVVAAVFATAATVLVLAACGTHTTGPQKAHPSGASSAAGHPATTVTTLAGHTVRVPSSKPTALFFFTAAGCEECAAGAKNFVQAAHQSGSSATMLAVDMAPHESTAEVNNFLHDIGEPGLPAALDPGGALTRTYRVTALSTAVVIDPAGQVVYHGVAPATGQILDALAKAGRQ